MAVGENSLGRLRPVPGVRLGTVAAGIRKPNRPDLVLFELAEGAHCSAVLTRNRFRAAPILLTEQHLAASCHSRYWLVNTGYANAGNGAQGLNDALSCVRRVAEQAHCAVPEVLMFSTGVIGEPLPVDRIVRAIPSAFAELADDAWEAAAYGIMTTDTRPKGTSSVISIAGQPVTLTGIAKGAGMIRPDMATMLAFLATDAVLDPGWARQALRAAADVSFNRITVDGDTSTNDACVLAATGRSGVRIDGAGESGRRFLAALTEACRSLALAIVRDGEGATRLVHVAVAEAADAAEAARVAFAIAESPLVKTAVFAGDPNWGRILAAVGRADIADMELDRVRIFLDDLCVVENGARSESYQESEAVARMNAAEIEIRVVLGRGDAATSVWTCDLSYDYITINADYRT
ncbi:MAG: bifunctional glutamate N-acetyltransferase/amino-acid acetyltransferase ArgJ [Nitrococcus mobilis]|nr:bifunctional glutamate N-acetyltransferase/amino-acid acetyltransferase ArgJ [Nitrococcus mobilis]